jgi:hypothetical protein
VICDPLSPRFEWMGHEAPENHVSARWRGCWPRGSTPSRNTAAR